MIIIARDLAPSQTATFDPQRVLGFCITTGGPTAHIAILAITGHTLPGDRQRALDAGCDDYISKPLDIPQFLQTVAAHLPATD